MIGRISVISSVLAPVLLGFHGRVPRVGVWGLLVGAFSFSGMPLPQRLYVLIPGFGLLVGGIGPFLASSIVSLRLGGRFRSLEKAAILGLGIGAAACLLGAAMLFGVPAAFGELVVLTWLTVPVPGLALILLFGVGLVKRLVMKEGSGPEFTEWPVYRGSPSARAPRVRAYGRSGSGRDVTRVGGGLADRE